ncbi:MAG: hypothetical protein AB7K68_06600 [Bacteriovoracia bacterium]
MDILLLFFLVIFSVSAKAEPCPTYNDVLPAAVVDVTDFKFFFFPQHEKKPLSDVVLVEKKGALFDLQYVDPYRDPIADAFILYNKNLSLDCSYHLGRFDGVSYTLSDGTKFTFSHGACRGDDPYGPRLECDSVPLK